MTKITKSTTRLGIIWLTCFVLFNPQPGWASEGNIDTSNKYAWSENAGWLNFRPTNAGVTAHGTYLFGYAWAENIGWIKLGSGAGPYDNNSSTNWGVNRDSGTGALSGYAWSEIAGWVNFNSTNSQVIINTATGSFDGYAWSENVGWVHFKYDDPAYNVAVIAPIITSFTPPSGGTDTSVTITGTHFAGTTEVKFGGTDASSFAVNSSTQITATVGTGSTGKVTVTTPGGTATSAADFIYTAVAAGSYYVNIATGNDSNDGLFGNPWKTIHHAISRINIGSSGTYVLHVALGTYSVANGEADAWITLSQDSVTIIGEDGSAPVWDGTGGTRWAWGIDITGSNVTLQNLDITGFSDNNEIGIGISSGSGSAVMNCRIYQNTVGVNIEGSSPEINRNKIYDNVKGIVVWANTSTTVSPTITNNSIYESTSAVMNYGILINGNGGVARPVIYHNSIDGGSGDGIAVEQTTTSILEPVIKYNIITRCDQYGIDVVSGATCTINYNDVWGNIAGNYNGCTAGPDDISQDPKNGMASELTADSPCIDVIPTGTPPNDPVEIDYLGYSRPKGSGFDMGAYEYVGTITDSPTMPGGTGTVTDYRIFTVPLNVGTGADMLSAMEASLGTYNPALWRVVCTA